MPKTVVGQVGKNFDPEMGKANNHIVYDTNSSITRQIQQAG